MQFGPMHDAPQQLVSPRARPANGTLRVKGVLFLAVLPYLEVNVGSHFAFEGNLEQMTDTA